VTLQEADPKRLILELARYTRWCLWRLDLTDSRLVNGVRPAEVALGVVNKFLNGERHYDSGVHQTLEAFLKVQIAVQLSDLRHPNIPRSHQHGDARRDMEALGRREAARSSHETDPEREFFARLRHRRAKVLLREIRAAVRRVRHPQLRDELRRVLVSVCRGNENPMTIAAATHISRRRVDQCLYRLEQMAVLCFRRLSSEKDLSIGDQDELTGF
jgi:hypothetical protein